MRYPGCAAGGMRRVRRNAASKLNNGRCTSQNKRYELASCAGRKLRDCGLKAAPLLALEGRKVDITRKAQERTVRRRPVCARPSPDAEILGHRLLVATASPRYLGNRERVFWPKRLEHAVIVTPCRSCANRASGRERSPISVTPFWRHRDQQTLMVLGPSPGGCARVGSPKDNGRRRRGQEQPFLPLADLCGGRTASPLLN
jgi:hypothetical protein